MGWTLASTPSLEVRRVSLLRFHSALKIVFICRSANKIQPFRALKERNDNNADAPELRRKRLVGRAACGVVRVLFGTPMAPDCV